MSEDKRAEQAYNLLTELACGHLEARGIPSDAGDEMDAIIVGLNMLGEELSASYESLRRASEELETQVTERTADLANVNKTLNQELIERKKTEYALLESEDLFRSLFENSPISLWNEDFTDLTAYVDKLRQSGVTDFKDYFDSHPESVANCVKMVKIIDVNKATLKLYHANSKDDFLEGLNRIFIQETLPAFKEELITLAENKTGFDLESINQTLTGEKINVELSGTIVPGEGETSHRVFVSISDITRLKQTELTLVKSNEDLAWSVREMEKRNLEMSFLGEMGNHFQACNTGEEVYAVIAQYGSRLFATESGILYIFNNSRNALEVMATWGKAKVKELTFEPDSCWALRRGRLHVVDEDGTGITCPHLNDLSPAASICIPLVAHSEILGVFTVLSSELAEAGLEQPDVQLKHFPEPKLQLAIAIAEHIALALANLKLRETLRLLSIRDPLTNLFNRRYMEETLKRELKRAERKGTSLGIIMIDIDHFKLFNDNSGHEVGDIVLQALGNFLLTHLRGEDVACRFGGEEFILILPDSAVNETRKRAEEFRTGAKQLNAHFNGKMLDSISLSLGVSEYPNNGKTVEDLLRAADHALYHAKAMGRDRVEVAE